MELLTQKSAKQFLAKNPTKLATYTNSIGQVVTFFEHPERGDSAPVFVKIANTIANTGFYDIDDFTTTINNIVESTEYMPILRDNRIDCEFIFD